jgi:prevent-host-death family protein
MPQFNIHEAKSNLSHLLDMVARGEEVVLAKHGHPVARIVPIERRGLVLGSGKNDTNINQEVLAKDDWWEPMSADEADAFIEGR